MTPEQTSNPNQIINKSCKPLVETPKLIKNSTSEQLLTHSLPMPVSTWSNYFKEVYGENYKIIPNSVLSTGICLAVASPFAAKLEADNWSPAIIIGTTYALGRTTYYATMLPQLVYFHDYKKFLNENNQISWPKIREQAKDVYWPFIKNGFISHAIMRISSFAGLMQLGLGAAWANVWSQIGTNLLFQFALPILFFKKKG